MVMLHAAPSKDSLKQQVMYHTDKHSILAFHAPYRPARRSTQPTTDAVLTGTTCACCSSLTSRCNYNSQFIHIVPNVQRSLNSIP